MPPAAATSDAASPPSCLSFPYVVSAVVLSAMAGGMGWGIRGQYGHETGAMIAGVLVGFTVLLFFVPQATSLAAARTVALLAMGISFGGSMTYGQTVGLTHDGPLIGHWGALRWGLLGLFIKGGIWIGYAGVFLGMALSSKRYRPGEITLLFIILLVLLMLGIRVLNSPFDPANRVLPAIYFSDDWYWEPDGELKPRPECWGGLLFGLIGLTAYATWVRQDRLVRNLSMTGFLAGGLGFSLGQSIQAFHAWNLDLFQSGLFASVEPHMNWWNMMEITFGAIAGAGLAIGVWLNRRLIALNEKQEEHRESPFIEFVTVALLLVHVALVIGAEFLSIRLVGLYLQYGVILTFLPLLGIFSGRLVPYLVALPVVAVPIAGKTLRELAYRSSDWSVASGWLVLVLLPIAILTGVAIHLAFDGRGSASSRRFVAVGLPLATWIYFSLNWAFFRFPWPWSPWTGRTPSGIIFLVCAISLTFAAVLSTRGNGGKEAVTGGNGDSHRR